MLHRTGYKKAHFRHSPVVFTHSTLDKYFYLAQSAIISPPSFLSLVFDRYFSISFRDKQGSNTARRTSASIPTILSWGPLSYRACVCVLFDVCYNFFSIRGQHKIILQHSRSKSSTKPLDQPIQNSDSVGPCSHVIPSHRP